MECGTREQWCSMAAHFLLPQDYALLILSYDYDVIKGITKVKSTLANNPI